MGCVPERQEHRSCYLQLIRWRTVKSPSLAQNGAMKRIASILAVLLCFPLGAQALNKKLTNKSYMDARHCLQLPTTTEIVKCAEKYM